MPSKADQSRLGVLIKVIDRLLILELEVATLRSILADKGMVTHEEFAEAEAVWKQHEAELRARSGQTRDEFLSDVLRKFQGGPKQ